VWSADLYAFVPVDTHPFPGDEELAIGLFGVSFGVGIFDAEDHFSAGVAGPTPVEQGGADQSNVRGAGWSRRKAHTALGVGRDCRNIVRIAKLAHGVQV